MKKYIKKLKITSTLFMIYLSTLLCVTRVSAQGNVAEVIEKTWVVVEDQIKIIVNNVVFPALSVILVISFFVKLGSAYFDYKRNNGNFEWQSPAILFACLVFTLSAPSFIWTII